VAPRGWAYNVIRITNTKEARYTFSLQGDKFGSEGAPSHFRARIVVVGPNGPAYTKLSMTSAQDGLGSVKVTDLDTELYLVIASVPEHFTGNQTYGYSVRIEME